MVPICHDFGAVYIFRAHDIFEIFLHELVDDNFASNIATHPVPTQYATSFFASFIFTLPNKCSATVVMNAHAGKFSKTKLIV